MRHLPGGLGRLKGTFSLRAIGQALGPGTGERVRVARRRIVVIQLLERALEISELGADRIRQELPEVNDPTSPRDKRSLAREERLEALLDALLRVEADLVVDPFTQRQPRHAQVLLGERQPFHRLVQGTQGDHLPFLEELQADERPLLHPAQLGGRVDQDVHADGRAQAAADLRRALTEAGAGPDPGLHHRDQMVQLRRRGEPAPEGRPVLLEDLAHRGENGRATCPPDGSSLS